MDLARANELLEMCTFKQGYNSDQIRVTVEDYFMNSALRVHAKVPDTYRPENGKGDVILTSRIPPLEMLDDVQFLECVLRAWLEFEAHEVREGFKVNGVLWENPHAREQAPIEGIR